MANVPIIGINLGAAASTVAIYKNSCCEVIANEDGNLMTPSFVAFAEEQLIGEEAKSCLKVDASNVVFNFKQMIGRQFNDEIVKRKQNEWPFDVVEGSDEKPRIKVEFRKESITFSCEQISSILLAKMKSIAENQCQQQIQNVVISVPSLFNSHQRQATINAAKISGFKNIRLINDTIAISLSYLNHFSKRRAAQSPQSSAQNILVVDLGASSFEASVVSISAGNIQVKSTCGSCDLGGSDFTERLVQHLLSKLERENNCNLKSNKNALQRLRCYCEEAKVHLSKRTETRIQISHLLQEIHLNETVSRELFETICGDLFHSISAYIGAALLDANLEVDDFYQIVMVGGGSKMPKINELLRTLFVDKSPNYSLYAVGDCIAIGAAMQAAIISGSNSEATNVKIRSIIPFSIGIETSGGVMSRVIIRNTKIACRHKKCFTTSVDDQRQLKVKIFQGESILTKHNHLIGVFTFDGFCLSLKGEPQIELYFEVDLNGVLTIYGSERLKSQRTDSTSNNCEATANEAVIFQREEERRMLRSEAKHNLEKAIFDANHALSKLNDKRKSELRSWLLVVKQWLVLNPFASKDQLDQKKVQIENLVKECM